MLQCPTTTRPVRAGLLPPLRYPAGGAWLKGFALRYRTLIDGYVTLMTMTDDKKQLRRERQRSAIRDEIKNMARAHMAAQGAAALSLRAVASDLGLSSAAIYYYFPNRDELITALIIDAFRAFGAALRQAAESDSPITARLMATAHAYRDWALSHPAEYALLFGTPIPGYQAPSERTAPEARDTFAIVPQLFAIAQQQHGLHQIPEALPGSVERYANTWLASHDLPIAPAATIAAIRAWALIHGLVSLELYHHTQPVIGDAAALFSYEIRNMLWQFGLALEPGAV